MSPGLGQIIGRAEKGTRFRSSELPQTEFEVLGLDIEEVGGEELLVGYYLQEHGPRVAHAPYYGKVYQGAGGEYPEGSVEIVREE